jgi:hypothetical protein
MSCNLGVQHELAGIWTRLNYVNLRHLIRHDIKSTFVAAQASAPFQLRGGSRPTLRPSRDSLSPK